MVVGAGDLECDAWVWVDEALEKSSFSFSFLHFWQIF
jgi:hypothetical protein